MARNWTKPGRKYYAIRKGKQCGVVVYNWADCEKLVQGFKGAIYKSFTNESEAIDFATTKLPYGLVGNETKKAPCRKNETLNQRFNRLNHCIERKTYRDPFTGELYTNRCIRRQGPVVVGANYVESDDTSVPWSELC